MGARITSIAAAAAVALIAGCGGDDSPDTSSVRSTATTQPPTRVPGVGSGAGGVKLERVGEFEQPLYVTQPPESDDLYVVEKQGRVRIVRHGEVVEPPALDIRDEVSADGEQGLLSIAFPPDFQQSLVVYAYFTGTDQDQHVVRYGVAGDGSFDRGSEQELLHMDDFASNHNGGLLLFGSDGFLYIGTGDGGRAEDAPNAQDLGSLLGKLLRLDPSRSEAGRAYAIPAENPFVGQPGARPEICDFGLRNPWRFSFDSATGALLIADVGAISQEEVDYAPASRTCGSNFGWPAFEGTERFNEDQSSSGTIPPILTYGHDRGECSITGGYVVRDRSLPTLYGRYVYGDLCVGDLRSFDPSGGRARDDRALGLHVDSLDSFGVDNGGKVYAVSLDGPVYRFTPE